MTIRVPQVAFVLFFACCGPMAQALADAQVRLIETHPAASASLGRQEQFWVRLEYTSDEPVRLWARPYRNGARVDAMSNSSMPHVGTGEALGWFALTQAGYVDELRIIAGGGNPYREWELARYPVRLAWTEAAASNGSRPQWVSELLAVAEQHSRAEMERRMNEPVTASDRAFMNGFVLTVLVLFVACLAVPLRYAWQWRGGWRVAAAAPAVLMLLVILRIIVDTARDPTSHNLWPFEILQFGVVGLAFVGVLKLVRKIKGLQ